MIIKIAKCKTVNTKLIEMKDPTILNMWTKLIALLTWFKFCDITKWINLRKSIQYIEKLSAIANSFKGFYVNKLHW